MFHTSEHLSEWANGREIMLSAPKHPFDPDRRAVKAAVRAPAVQSNAARQFVLASLLGLIGLCIVKVALFDAGATRGLLIGVATYLVASLVSLAAFTRSYPYDAMGLCNAVTLARLMLVGVLIAAVFDQTDRLWTVFAVAAVALSLDGVDGWLARREGHASQFGARFDVEVDAAFALTLAVLAHVCAGAGAHVLLLALPHYLFSAAAMLFPWLGGPLPARFSRKAICVFQLSVLLAILAPPVQPPVSDGLVGLALAALAWSFWVDIRTLQRAHS